MISVAVSLKSHAPGSPCRADMNERPFAPVPRRRGVDHGEAAQGQSQA
jgi:hypothetical protein